MDVLSPELLWIEDRCYRLPVLDPRLTGYESDDEKHLGGNWEEAGLSYDNVLYYIKLANEQINIIFFFSYSNRFSLPVFYRRTM